jgi:hypothetical protein
VNWDTYRRQIERGKYLKSLVEEEKVARGFVYRLHRYARQKHRFESGLVDDPHSGLWRSHFRYDVSRNINKEYQEEIMRTVLDEIDSISIAANYVMYATRKEG